MPAHRGVEALGARALQDVVVLEIPAGGLEVAIARPARRRDSPAAEEVVLELGSRERRESQLAAPRRPARGGSTAARRARARASSRRARRTAPARVFSSQLATAASPDRARGGSRRSPAPSSRTVARDRLHLHVDREEIVAGVRAVRRSLVDEQLGVEPLAHQPAVVVGEADDDGLDSAARRRRTQLVECQRALPCRALVHDYPPCTGSCCAPGMHLPVPSADARLVHGTCVARSRDTTSEYCNC